MRASRRKSSGGGKERVSESRTSMSLSLMRDRVLGEVAGRSENVRLGAAGVRVGTGWGRSGDGPGTDPGRTPTPIQRSGVLFNASVPLWRRVQRAKQTCGKGDGPGTDPGRTPAVAHRSP